MNEGDGHAKAVLIHGMLRWKAVEMEKSKSRDKMHAAKKRYSQVTTRSQTIPEWTKWPLSSVGVKCAAVSDGCVSTA